MTTSHAERLTAGRSLTRPVNAAQTKQRNSAGSAPSRSMLAWPASKLARSIAARIDAPYRNSG